MDLRTGDEQKVLEEVIEHNGRLKVLNAVAQRLKEAMRAQLSLREFTGEFLTEFCEPELQGDLRNGHAS